ncbi:MAG: hypothetical protein H6597_07595 [Flavobacteriales bacterium]|nr:hypothetical protein [Flavobacteriales bacterium]MCB9194384.1 hypothetical protein [Flavobacteriales bacterium]
MARSLLSLGTLLVATTVHGQQITNGGFEDWHMVTQYSVPDSWGTGNGQYPGVATTMPVGNAPSGNLAARMETHIIGTDTLYGFILLGSIVDDIPLSGASFTTAVSAIEGYVRYDQPTGDSAIVLVEAWQSGTVTIAALFHFGGSQPTWTSFALPLNGGAEFTPDSVLIGIASSDVFSTSSVTDGAWIEVDALRLTAPSVILPDELPNHDMEQWTDIVTNDPTDWTTYNGWLAYYGETPAEQSTDANTGAYSLKLSSLQVNGGFLPGIVTNGQLGGQGPYGGIPYTAMPTMLDGALRYVPNGTDSAAIAALFYANGVLVGAGVVPIVQPYPFWTDFSMPVTFNQAPDTMLLVIYSGDSAGSSIWVDDLSFQGISVGLAGNNEEGPVVFPNPVDDLLHVNGIPDGTVVLRNTQGRIVRRTRSSAMNEYVMDVHDIPNGDYLLTTEEGRERRSWPVVVQH